MVGLIGLQFSFVPHTVLRYWWLNAVYKKQHTASPCMLFYINGSSFLNESSKCLKASTFWKLTELSSVTVSFSLCRFCHIRYVLYAITMMTLYTAWATEYISVIGIALVNKVKLFAYVKNTMLFDRLPFWIDVSIATVRFAEFRSSNPGMQLRR